MWPFSRKKSPLERAVAAFSPFLSKEVLEALKDPSKIDAKKFLDEKEVSFILLNVRDGSPREVLSHLSDVLDDETAKGLIVNSLISSLVFAYLWKDSGEIRDFAERFLETGGANVRILYGREICLQGTLGLPGGGIFGTIVPDFNEVLKLLTSSEFGTMIEWSRP